MVYIHCSLKHFLNECMLNLAKVSLGQAGTVSTNAGQLIKPFSDGVLSNNLEPTNLSSTPDMSLKSS